MVSPRKRPRRRPRPEVSSRGRKAFGLGFVAVLALFLAVGLGLWWGSHPRNLQEPPIAPWQTNALPPVSRPIIEPDNIAFAKYAGSDSCRECHEDQTRLWEPSNHALAERLPSEALDAVAFQPSRAFQHGTNSSTVRLTNETFQVICEGFNEVTQPYEVVGVIGNDPLIQYLVPAFRGRLQTLEASYDPRSNQWFNVYGDEDRHPGEWGHWTGRGMTWNVQCAACHNTRLRKHYDEATDSYHTTKAEMSVGCEACHGPMKAHAEWRREYPDPTLKDPTIVSMNAYQVMYTCASCHSRRLELTGDFVPGDLFNDHYGLTLVDDTDLYFPDGQVMGENYVYSSFLSSRMHGAGVRCVDCHDPHSSKNTLSGNDLCMRCHNGGYANSPIIDPKAHGFHKLDDLGGQCVGCHMPYTTYMQRHPRRDHGFTIPDPLLTQELGIPNACNRCHDDKDVAWSIEWVNQWYGERMERITRRRARVIASARADKPSARRQLLSLLSEEPLGYWQAVYVGLLGRWAHDPEVRTTLFSVLTDSEPLVRAQAVQSLALLAREQDSEVIDRLHPLLTDPMRLVRFRAAWALQAEVDPQSLAGKELLHVLRFNSDQPAGQVQQGIYNLSRNQPHEALKHYRNAVAWDPYSAPLREELAVVLSMTGHGEEALEQMQKACELEPNHSEYRYRLALAWNEVGRLDQALAELTQTVRIDPTHDRAWYNLGLARNAAGQPEDALEALRRAESLSPSDPRIPYARATILAQLSQLEEARAATQRALQISPHFEAAKRLLQHLGP